VLASLAYLAVVPGIPTAALCGWIWIFVNKRDKHFRRPFEEMPRPAGWSLQNRMTDLMDRAMMQLMAAFIVGGFACAFSISATRSPLVYILPGLIACSVFCWRSAVYLKNYANHRLGFLGEQVVGQILDRLSSDSLRVFHDLEIREPGKSPWNIDHVVLTPAGVFSIETKCRRKPRATAPDGQQGHKLIFDGHQIIFPHPMQPDRHGLDQAEDNAKWLAGKLTALNGSPIPVTPLLVFPGWWVDRTGKGPVTVLNHNQLPGYLKGRENQLTESQQRAINAQLDERCRIDLSQPV
jgi:hypothetical protein